MIDTLVSTPQGLALVVALAVGLTHAIAHNIAGNNRFFAAAGVNAAGIAVSAGSGIATFVILTRPEVLIL